MYLRKSIQSFMRIIPVLFYSAMSVANSGPYPCAKGGEGLFDLVDRPTLSDSACAVPYGKAVIETGAQYLNLLGGVDGGNFPETEVRVGLPRLFELFTVLPSVNFQSVFPHSGANAQTVGVKSVLGYNQQWIGAVETVVILPTGTGAYGTENTGILANSIITYSPSAFSMSLMIGGGRQSQSRDQGGGTYGTFNPDLVLSWQMNDRINFYAETYGQTATGPDQGSGFNFDGGILYLLLHNVLVDAEYGQRLWGQLLGFNQYVGVGCSVLF